MKKFNTFYVLLAVVLVIVFLKTSCMGDAKQQECTQVFEERSRGREGYRYVEGGDGCTFGNGQTSVGICRGDGSGCA